jgi:hypothetical protein
VGVIGFLKRGGAGAFLAFVLGTILAAASRPEGAHVLIPHLAILLCVPATRRRRSVVGIALALLASLAFVYVRYILEYGGQLAGQTRVLFADPATLLWTVVLSGDYTPLAWIIVWTMGLVLGLRQRAAWVAIVILVGLHVTWSSTGLYDSFVGYERQVASARYESILLLPFAIGTALFVQAGLAARPWLKATLCGAFAAVTLMTYPRAYETLLRPFTVDYEYRFLRRHTLTLPPQSQLYILQPPVNDIGFVDADLTGLFVRRDVRFEAWNPLQRDGLPSGRDAYLYIGSSCAALVDERNRPLGADYPRWLRECASIRSRVAGNALEEIEVPARKMSWHEFEERTVRLGLYRLPQSSPAQ